MSDEEVTIAELREEARTLAEDNDQLRTEVARLQANARETEDLIRSVIFNAKLAERAIRGDL